MYINSNFSRLEIKLNNCLDNYRYFKSKLKTSTKLLVLIKANAYGHGAVEFAELMENIGVDYFAVAYPIEGVELRNANIQTPIIVLTAGTDSFEQIIDNELEPGIPNLSSLKILCSILEEREITDFPIHIKLDTGMHRLGFMTGDIIELLDFLNNNNRVKVKSIYSHLAAADDPSCDDFTFEQIQLFLDNANGISEKLKFKPMYHILNSAGIERFPEYQFDMVRLGIGIYGVSSIPGVRLAPVAHFKCKIIQLKTLSLQDGTIGYGRKGLIATDGTVVATVPVGYADGISRALSCGKGYFSIKGHKVPIIGNVCMDMCMLDVTDVDVKVGDTVTIFGEDPTISDWAECLGTIPYEILTSVPRRIKRVVLK